MNYSDKQRYVQKYLTNEMSSLEKENFVLWLEESDENKLLYRQFNDIWANANYTTEVKFDYLAAYQSHKSKLNDSDLKPKREAKVLTPTFIRSIASLLIIIILSIVVIKWIRSSKTYKTSDDHIFVTLDDGTKVWMDVKSELKVIQLTQKVRSVKLVGKAFFDVAHLENNPFKIETNNANIKVLGTKFLVDTRTEIVNVEIGKVEVSNTFNKVIVTDNQSVTYTKNDISEVHNIPFDQNMLWFNEELKFDNATFDKVIADISKEYNLTIQLPSKNNWKDCLFTSGSLKGNTFEQILTIMEVTYDLEYTKINDTTYIFTRVNCK